MGQKVNSKSSSSTPNFIFVLVSFIVAKNTMIASVKHKCANGLSSAPRRESIFNMTRIFVNTKIKSD